MARWVSYEEASAYTGLSVRQLTRGRADGRIPGSANPTGGSVVWNLDVLDRWLEAAMDTRALADGPEQFAVAAKREARNRRRKIAAGASRAPGSRPAPLEVGGRGESSGEEVGAAREGTVLPVSNGPGPSPVRRVS